MTGNISVELDCAKAILKTYHQVNDGSFAGQKHKTNQVKVRKSLKTQDVHVDLETELLSLQEKYLQLQNELNSKEALVDKLNRQLLDRTSHLERLQEDFENVIYQFTNVAIGNKQ